MNNTEKDIKTRILKRAVLNLKEFGYENCNEENILTDEVYKIFFKKQLENVQGESNNADVEKVITDLIADTLKEAHHVVQCEIHVKKSLPYDAAVEALGIIRKNGIKDATNKNKTGYIVKWAIDMFGKNSIEAATKEAYEWIKEGRGKSLCHVFTIQDKKTKECCSVDLDTYKSESILPLTELQFKKG